MAIAHQLTAQLMRMATLPPDLLCGHAAQIEFWADEVAHCLSVLDTYEARFHAMLAQQKSQVGESDPVFFRPVPRPGYIPEPHRYHVRAELCRAFGYFATACARKTQTDHSVIADQCDKLGIGIET